MKRWKKITLGIMFGGILFVIGLMQHIVLGIICAIILTIAYALINVRDNSRQIMSNRYNRQKYYDCTRKR